MVQADGTHRGTDKVVPSHLLGPLDSLLGSLRKSLGLCKGGLGPSIGNLGPSGVGLGLHLGPLWAVLAPKPTISLI